MGAMFWAIATAVFAILEIVIPGLVTIWLALAALIVTVFAGFINNPTVEFVIFAVFSLIFVIFTRPVLRRYIQKADKKFSPQMKGSEIKIEKVVNTDKQKKEYDKMCLTHGADIVKIKNFEGNKIILERK